MTRETLYSIGHGSRSAEDLLALLGRHGIECLVDVRAYPRSKRHPQFSGLVLEAELAAAGVRYVWEGAALGGMRRPGRASRHTGLADAAFRGYADHMETSGFGEALLRLIELGARRRTAFMCAEVMPCYCHRSFIADALALQRVDVWHVVGPEDTRRHALNPAARIEAGSIVYDLGEQAAFAF